MDTRPKRVLLVDDDEAALPLFADVLQGAGFEVRTSSSVDKVLDSVGDWRPDVILTDVNMPGTSGIELCRQLKAAYATADVPVLLFPSPHNGVLESPSPSPAPAGVVGLWRPVWSRPAGGAARRPRDGT